MDFLSTSASDLVDLNKLLFYPPVPGMDFMQFLELYIPCNVDRVTDRLHRRKRKKAKFFNTLDNSKRQKFARNLVLVHFGLQEDV